MERQPRHPGHLRGVHRRSGKPRQAQARRTVLRGGRCIRHVRAHRVDRHAGRGTGRTGDPGADQRCVGRRRDVCGARIAKALGAEVTGVCSTRNLELARSLGADHVIDYTVEDFTQGERRYDVVLDNVMNHPPSATARVLSPTGIFIPNSIGNSGGFFAGLPRMARAGMLGRGSIRVQFRLLCGEPGEPRCPRRTPRVERRQGGHRQGLPTLSEAPSAVAHMLGHHARGQVVIAV